MPQESSLTQFRSHFPMLANQTYLDTAAWGLLHEGLFEWRRAHDRDFLEGGSRFKIPAMELLRDTRKRIAACFGGKPERIALLPNYSLGENLLLEGLSPDLSVALLDKEYPSVSWPFEQRGFSIYRVSRDQPPEKGLVEVLEKNKPDILALSLVQWIDGMLIAPEFLRSLKDDFPDLLILADGTQYLGAYGIDFESSGIDILGASGYKWMLGGNGNGFIMLSEAAEDRIAVRSSGFNAAGGDPDFSGTLTLARSLEPGHLDTLNFGSLHYSLGLLMDLGIDAVESYNKILSAEVGTALAQMGLLSTQLAEREHSTIYNIPFTEARFEALQASGVVCSRRGGGIRLSFHCYNTGSDLERLTAALRSAG